MMAEQKELMYVSMNRNKFLIASVLFDSLVREGKFNEYT